MTARRNVDIVLFMSKYLKEVFASLVLPAVVAITVFLGFTFTENVIGKENIPYPAIVAGWAFGVVFARPIDGKDSDG